VPIAFYFEHLPQGEQDLIVVQEVRDRVVAGDHHVELAPEDLDSLRRPDVLACILKVPVVRRLLAWVIDLSLRIAGRLLVFVRAEAIGPVGMTRAQFGSLRGCDELPGGLSSAG
jgi:hypothetical protein